MADQDGLQVRVVSRRLVRASDSIEPHVLAVSNLDLFPQTIQTTRFCIYPRPLSGDFNAAVATFEAGLPSLLNYFFPLAGRITTNPRSGLPEAIHCANQGAELVVGDATSVALASLVDYGASSFRRLLLPFDHDVALSVQVVSFACGGFAVSWRSNHVVVDAAAMGFVISAWSELARSGTFKGARPNHDRWIFRPRAPPSYSAVLDEELTPLDAQRQINVLTTEQSFVRRLYFVDASDIERLRHAASRDGHRATRVQAVSAYLWKALAGVVGTADTHCRMGWWVNGRPRIRAPAMRSYFGNLTTFVVREVSAQEVQRMPLADVAAVVRETIVAPDYDKHFQELVDWVEEHKTERYIEAASVGLGSPAVIVTAFASPPVDTDFGFGRAVMALPMSVCVARLCSGYVEIAARPGDDGSWIVSAFLWPRLAAALESDEPRIFKPVTAKCLGLSAPPVHARL